MAKKEQQPQGDDNIGNVDPMIEVQMQDLDLPVPMTREERLQYGEEMAAAQNDAEQNETKREAVNKEYKGAIERANSLVSEIARLLRHGKLTKKVQCRVVRDYRLGWIRTVRLDDETEVNSRPMTHEERQMGIVFGNEGAA